MKLKNMISEVTNKYISFVVIPITISFLLLPVASYYTWSRISFENVRILINNHYFSNVFIFPVSGLTILSANELKTIDFGIFLFLMLNIAFYAFTLLRLVKLYNGKRLILYCISSLIWVSIGMIGNGLTYL